MCGIAGIYAPDAGAHSTALDGLASMVDAERHRGPDGRRIWTDPERGVALGHCRLSILELSALGDQPMTSASGRYVLTFNGEIYNYLELREELRTEGAEFRGNSDTEVLLEGIVRWGIAPTLEKANGMFAFGLWDKIGKTLTLARDRAGKKPLYYAVRGGALYFASELKSLKALKLPLAVDEDSLYHYLTFGFVPAPQSIYQGVSKVPAAQVLTVDGNMNLTADSYWRPSWEKRSITFGEAVEETEALLKEAVKIRLRADVPVGCFLSGGIDSGLLTAFASAHLSQPLKTFTVALPSDSLDESRTAALVAARYGTDHQTLRLSPDISDVLTDVVKAFDEPFADASAVPSCLVSREARKYVKVVLNGEGGDELFAGYRRQRAVNLFEHYHAFFNGRVRPFWGKLALTLPPPRAFRSRYAFAHRFLRGVGLNAPERYIAWCVDGFDEKEKGLLYQRREEKACPSPELLSRQFGFAETLGPMGHCLALDFLLNMHNDMLTKMDIATMSSGLEGRNPFLDYRLVEWAFSLPAEVVFKGRSTKPVLRALARKYLPEAVSGAPKRGFEIPLIEWLRKDLSEAVREVCLCREGIIGSVFDRRYVEALLLGRQRLDPDRWSKRVWNLFMLGMWESSQR